MNTDKCKLLYPSRIYCFSERQQTYLELHKFDVKPILWSLYQPWPLFQTEFIPKTKVVIAQDKVRFNIENIYSKFWLLCQMHADRTSTFASVSKWNSGKVNCVHRKSISCYQVAVVTSFWAQERKLNAKCSTRVCEMKSLTCSLLPPLN